MFMKSFKLTFMFCILFGVCYILVLWGFARVFGPNGGNAEVVALNGKVVGAASVGQGFTRDIYFWGRPSCAGDGYDASRSGGSDKGPSDEEYLSVVEARVDTFLAHHPYLRREEVPAELVTASASGLDPHISPKAAFAQAERVAKARRMPLEKVLEIVSGQVESPLFGLFGPETVNVLSLNIALEKAANRGR